MKKITEGNIPEEDSKVSAIVDSIGQLTIAQISLLIAAIQVKFNVTLNLKFPN